MISLQNVFLKIDGRNILNNISMQIERGGLHIILGENGAGKSSLLSLIAGDVSANSGELALKGRDLSCYSLKELALCRSFLLQENNIFFSMTVKEICSLGRAPHYSRKLSHKNDVMIMKYLKALDLDSIVNKKFTEISGGEKQRTHIARVLCQDTNLILLDEPMNSLDIKHQLTLMNLLLSMVKNGKTVIAVMHDINLALRFATHLTLLKQGTMIYQGALDEFISLDEHACQAIFMQTFGVDFSLMMDPVLNRPQVKAF